MGSIPAEGSEFFFILYIWRFLATFNLPFENLTNNLQSEQEYRFKSDISQVDNLTSLGRVMYCSLTLRSEASSGSQVTVSCHKTLEGPSPSRYFQVWCSIAIAMASRIFFRFPGYFILSLNGSFRFTEIMRGLFVDLLWSKN